MGTNYYLRTDVCERCNRCREKIHIGKSSAGWPFLFRGYRAWPLEGVPHPITSAQHWRELIEIFTMSGSRITDEHGRDMPPEAFWAFVREKQTETKGPLNSAYRHGGRASEWFDDEGFRFCDSEFS